MLKWIKTLTNKGIRWVYVIGLDQDDQTVELYHNRQEYEGEYTEELAQKLDSQMRTYMRQAHQILVADIVLEKRVHNDHTVYEVQDLPTHIQQHNQQYNCSNPKLF